MAENEDWLDEALLTDDVSARGWKRKAVGMPAHEAALRVPRTGQLNATIPIEQWRIVRAHCRDQGVSLGMFLRHAIAAKLVAEGVNADLIPDLIRSKRDRPRPRGGV
jgi:hypothetical protein